MNSKFILKVISILTRILLILVVIAAAFLIGRKSYEFGYRVFAEKPMTDTEHAKKINIQITDGMSNKEIANMMEEKGLSRDARLFYIQMLCSDYKKTIQPGLYILSTDMTAEEILSIIGQVNEETKKADSDDSGQSSSKEPSNIGK